jgi:multicomponent Na+:H+ antiporter subunit A
VEVEVAGLGLAVAALFLLAVVAPWLTAAGGRRAAQWLAAVPGATFLWFLYEGVRGGTERRIAAFEWVPTLGIRGGFALDGLSLVFSLLITGIGALVLVYAGSYLANYRDRGRFFSTLLVFMGAMLGLVLADDLITLFVFWEITGVASYLLIGSSHEKPRARAAALQALLVTAGGGLALLVGLLLLGGAAGTYSISEILSQGGSLAGHPLYPAILVLIALGAFTKSAQWPFHFWLPNAMAAPTPVSAYLHSATMVKAGVYLLARLDPVLGGTPLWLWLITPVGVTTMLLGATLALRETDLKGVLAYSTLTALGTLVALLGLSLPEAVKAAVVFLVVHSLYKAGLFLVAGSVDHATGSRDIRVLSGLRGDMPWTAAAAVLGGLSMAGLPPLFGFVAKELAYKAKLGFGGGEILLPLLAVVANALTVAAAGIVALRPFVGPRLQRLRGTTEVTTPMFMGPLLLGLTGLVLGLAPTLLGDWLVGPSVRAVLGEPMEIRLALWYGWNPALLLSVITVGLGVFLYRIRHRLRDLLLRISERLPTTGEELYGRGLEALDYLASLQTRLLMRGGTPTALLVLLGTAGALLWISQGASVGSLTLPLPRVEWIAWLLAGLVVIEALGTVGAPSRSAGAAALGAMGFAVALLFVLTGAPDLATTQFLVETLIVLVLALVLHRLPRDLPSLPASPGRKVTAAVVALTLGSGFTLLLLGVVNQPFDPHLSEFFSRASVPVGKGRNIVNVILVDFRALDTLGEAAVLGIAALGILILTRRDPSPHEAGPGRGRHDPHMPGAGPVPSGKTVSVRGESPILPSVARHLVPLLLLFSIYLLWRGHNEPGGGFVAGLMATGALALRVQATGPASGLRLLKAGPTTYLAGGLGITLISALWSVAAGRQFMTGLWVEVPFPGESLKLGTPLLFDVGVYLLVLGFGGTVLLALEGRRA